MSYFHVSPTTNEPGRCVGPDRCKWKSDNLEHFENMADAVKQSERIILEKNGGVLNGASAGSYPEPGVAGEYEESKRQAEFDRASARLSDAGDYLKDVVDEELRRSYPTEDQEGMAMSEERAARLARARMSDPAYLRAVAEFDKANEALAAAKAPKSTQGLAEPVAADRSAVDYPEPEFRGPLPTEEEVRHAEIHLGDTKKRYATASAFLSDAGEQLMEMADAAARREHPGKKNSMLRGEAKQTFLNNLRMKDPTYTRAVREFESATADLRSAEENLDDMKHRLAEPSTLGGSRSSYPEPSFENNAPSYAAPVTKEMRAQAEAHVNRDNPDFASYYEATDKKHFGDRSEPGSKFTDPSLTKVEDVLTLAASQRGSLEGDDRDEFIRMGASPSAFNPNNRYLRVRTPGTVGVRNSADMADNDVVVVTRTKPGVPCSLVATVKEQGTTDQGVLVMTTNRDTGKPMLITTFPGPVTEPVRSDDIDALEGQVITVARAREILGKDFWANTKLAEG